MRVSTGPFAFISVWNVMFQRRHFFPGLQHPPFQACGGGNRRHPLLSLLLLLLKGPCRHIHSLGVSVPQLCRLNSGQLIEDLSRIFPANIHFFRLGWFFLFISCQSPQSISQGRLLRYGFLCFFRLGFLGFLAPALSVLAGCQLCFCMLCSLFFSTALCLWNCRFFFLCLSSSGFCFVIGLLVFTVYDARCSFLGCRSFLCSSLWFHLRLQVTCWLFPLDRRNRFNLYGLNRLLLFELYRAGGFTLFSRFFQKSLPLFAWLRL
ncbi:hypothetical protein D3C76_562690 [compost metagenome]